MLCALLAAMQHFLIVIKFFHFFHNCHWITEVLSVLYPLTIHDSWRRFWQFFKCSFVKIVFDAWIICDSEKTMTYPESSERLFLGLDLSTQQVSSCSSSKVFISVVFWHVIKNNYCCMRHTPLEKMGQSKNLYWNAIGTTEILGKKMFKNWCHMLGYNGSSG